MKLFHKIAITTLGLAMATAAGAGIVHYNRGDVKMTKADDMYEYNSYTSALTEGDYLITFSDKAMKAVISSSRFSYETIAVVNNKITTDDASIIWHITQSGDYWKFYNSSVSKYASSTGSNNQGALTTGTDDKSLWSLGNDISSGYIFTNKYNSDGGKNATLSNNGTYGFACYASGSAGRFLRLFKKGNKVTNVPVTGLSLSVSKTSLSYGEKVQITPTITPNDATNKLIEWSSSNTNVAIVDSDGYVTSVGEGSATITATALGGTDISATKTFTCSLPNTNDYCDLLNRNTIGVSGTSYTPWDSISANNNDASSAVYKGNTNGANSAIGIKADTGSGFVTTTSGGIAKKVSLIWNSNTASGRTLNILGSNSPINLATLSKDAETVATIVYGTSTEADLGAGYKHLAFISSNNALYLDSIVISWDQNLEPSLTLSDDLKVVSGDNAVFTATRQNSSHDIKWYIDDVATTDNVESVGDTSTLTINTSTPGTYEIKAALEEDSVEETATLVVVEKRFFAPVTSVEELVDGLEVILVGTKTVDAVDYTYVANTYESGNYLVSSLARFESDRIVANPNSAIFTIEHDDDGFMFESNGKYLDAAGGTSNNYLRVLADPAAEHWNIDFDPEKNLITNVNVAPTSNTFRGYVRFNPSTNGFACYASASQNPVQLYKAVPETYSTEAFADDVLSLTDAICTAANHGNGDLLAPVWQNLRYNKYTLLSESEKNSLKTVVANESGDKVARAMARYDHICKAYSFNNFLQRSTAEGANQLTLNASEQNIALLIAVTTSIVTISLAGVFFMLRKRKHQ